MDESQHESEETELSSSPRPSEITIVAFVNGSAGGKQGEKLQELLRQRPGCKVVDLTGECTVRNDIRFPYSALEEQPISGLVVMSCGGDGTHSWVWSAVSEFYGPEQLAQVSVIPMPLGSGNDLCNALGWGQILDMSALDDFLERVDRASHQRFDQWNVKFNSAKERQHHTAESFQWQNYLSVGFDARVSYEFEKCRQCCPKCCFSAKCINQFWYAMIGLPKVCDCCFKVRSVAQFWTRDDPAEPWEEVEIPTGSQAVVLLNISSYGAGINLWEPDQHPAMSSDRLHDGRVELVAVSGPCNFVCGRIGCCGFSKVCQARFVQIQANQSVCFQADGEGWLEEVDADPVIVEVSFHNQLVALRNNDPL